MKLLEGIKLLEEAYNKKDWDKVSMAYSLISGETLVSETLIIEPLHKTKKPRKKREPKIIKVVEQKVSKTDTKTKDKRQAITRDIVVGKNSFVDDGKLASNLKMKKAEKAKWVRPETRPEYKPVTVECKCGTSLEISPDLYFSETNYTCPSCLSKKR